MKGGKAREPFASRSGIIWACVLLFTVCLSCISEDRAEENTTVEDGMYILLLSDGVADLQAVEEGAKIVHAVSSRLYVVRIGPATRFQLASLPGVVAVEDRAFSAEIASRLDKKEALFAAAFAARSTTKERVGNGLPWDAPDFEPPDSPDDATENQRNGGTNDDK